MKVYDCRNMDESPIKIWRHCSTHLYSDRPQGEPAGRLPDNDRAWHDGEKMEDGRVVVVPPDEWNVAPGYTGQVKKKVNQPGANSKDDMNKPSKKRKEKKEEEEKEKAGAGGDTSDSEAETEEDVRARNKNKKKEFRTKKKDKKRKRPKGG